MTSSLDHVVVVGAGMVGLSTAWFLQEKGVKVTVVDKTGVAAGSSWGNAGWLAPALTIPLPDPAILASGIAAVLKPSSPVYVPVTTNPRLIKFLLQFARHCTPSAWNASMTIFNEANKVALSAFDAMAQSGTGAVEAPTKPANPFLAGFVSESNRKVLVEEFDRATATGGVVDYDLLDEAEIKALEPALGPAVQCGVRLNGQRFINPGEFVHSLADAIKVRGGEVLEGVTVEDVKDSLAGVTVTTTGSDDITADAVVLASGTWLGHLARDFGVKTIVQAGRGYSFTVHPEHVPNGPVYFPSERVACTPLGAPEDGLRVAGMMEFRKPGAPLDPRRVKAIIDAATPMLTGVDWEARHGEWVGSRPCTADGLPLVGSTKSPRVLVAGGHGMWGIALGPLTGSLLADHMTGTTHPLLKSFDPLR